LAVTLAAEWTADMVAATESAATESAATESVVPAVVFLPDIFYDYRVWADVPGCIGGNCDIVHYDRRARTPWAAPAAFLPAFRRLVRGRETVLVVAAGSAAGFAVHAAIGGMAHGLSLLQPVPDYRPPEASSDVPIQDLLQAAAPYAPLIAAARESDPVRRRTLVISTWRGIYQGKLADADRELVSRIIADHVEDVLAATAQVIAAAEAGAAAPYPGMRWLDRLGEVTIPVTVITSAPATSVGKSLAERIPAGRFVALGARSDLPWLEDRAGTVSVLRQMLSQAEDRLLVSVVLTPEITKRSSAPSAPYRPRNCETRPRGDAHSHPACPAPQSATVNGGGEPLVPMPSATFRYRRPGGRLPVPGGRPSGE
jgi:hypothetical protein